MFNRPIIVLLTLLLFATAARTQEQPKPEESPENQIAKTVVFITIPYEQNGTKKTINGTGFFVAVPDERIGKQGFFIYLVTNRHVATAEGATPDSPLSQVGLWLNLSQPQNGQTAFKITEQLTPSHHWYFPSDPTIDLAVLPGAPRKSFDIKAISTSQLATKEKVASIPIGIGDQVFFVGYFFQFPGGLNVDPIYRTGAIAMMPTDPIPMNDPDSSNPIREHLYLADAHAFLGNSGSPLFVRTGGFKNGSIRPTGVYLIGVVNGFIPETEDGKVTGAATFEGGEGNLPNSGILSFVPAQELWDLLYGVELQKQRDDQVAAQKLH